MKPAVLVASSVVLAFGFACLVFPCACYAYIARCEVHVSEGLVAVYLEAPASADEMLHCRILVVPDESRSLTWWAWYTGEWPNIMFPIWPVDLIAVTLIIAILRSGRSPRAGASVCACGYNLTGNLSGTCPECGCPVVASARESAERSRPRHAIKAVVRWCIMVACGLYLLVFVASYALCGWAQAVDCFAVHVQDGAATIDARIPEEWSDLLPFEAQISPKWWYEEEDQASEDYLQATSEDYVGTIPLWPGLLLVLGAMLLLARSRKSRRLFKLPHEVKIRGPKRG